MINETNSFSYDIAVRDFQRARRDATMQQMMARVRGKSATLLCFDEVRRQLRTGPAVKRGLKEIPLKKIVGSVGRYQDFTRDFLPKKDSDQERWVKVKQAISDMKGMPPIDVYQVGDVYFVQDGNHRVSIALQLGTETISANVTEIETRVPLTADDDPEEVICKARYTDFLEKTNIDKLCDGADLMMTFCGQYQVLLDQIEAECRFMSQNDDKECQTESWERAVVAWYKNVYMPIVKIIRGVGMIRRFPERTEADIYVLLSERREELEASSGWHTEMETAVPELLYQQQPLIDRVLDSVAPGLEDGPQPGQWRKQQLALRRENHLFENMLVVLEGNDDDWQILEQVFRLTHGDEDHILGLHVVPKKAMADKAAIAKIRAGFEERCQAAGLKGEFAVEYGPFRKALVHRAAWADLVIINLTHPPENNPIARIRSSWSNIIQRCPCPVLAIPNAIQSDEDRVLLAFDGSAKSEEALFVATYLTMRWQKELTVLTVKSPYTGEKDLDRARAYLEQHGVTWANYILSDGPINKTIMETAVAHDINLLIVGGFGRRSISRVVLGSSVEHLLREFKQPMLICR